MGAKRLVTLLKEQGTSVSLNAVKKILQALYISASPQRLALPQSGSQTVLKLTLWVRGTHPSIMQRERARAHQIGELI